MSTPYREQGLVVAEPRLKAPSPFWAWLRDWWREGKRLRRQEACGCRSLDSPWEWFSERRQLIRIEGPEDWNLKLYYRVQVFEKCKRCDAMRERARREPQDGYVYEEKKP